MITKWTSHQDYLCQLKLGILQLSSNEKNRLLKLHRNSLLKLSLLNLDNLFLVVKALYTVIGRPATNQCEIARSLAFMLDFKEHSITRWVRRTHSDDLIRLLCGFQPHSVPNVASYYNFLDRLWRAPKQNHLKLRKFKRKPSKKYKANTKLPNRKVGVVKRLCKALESGKLPDIRPERVLQLLLKHAVVDTSASLGILGHTSDMSIAMDGSPFYAGSSSYGVRICDCKAKGIYQCSCARKYSDIDAHWGWDSFRETWFYGDSLFSVTACDSHYDLPIFLQSAQASRHDGVSTVFAVRNVLQMYPDLNPTRFLADGAMDNHSIYKMVMEHGMQPFIPLPENTRYPVLDDYPQIKEFDKDGHPICRCSLPWAYSGFDTKKQRHKYRCPYAASKKKIPNCYTCLECNKTKSTYGPTFYLKSRDDVRLYPPVPRNSKQFNDVFKRRSSVERTFKRLFIDYGIEEYKARSRAVRFSLATFAAVNMHLDAWLQQLSISIEDFFPMLAA